MYNETHATSVFIKTNCSPNWKDVNISQKCYEGTFYDDLKSNLTANIPATGSKSKVTYRNWFCALCNFEKPDEIVVWMNTSLDNSCFLQSSINATSQKLSKTMLLNNTSGIDKALEFDGLRWYFKYNGGIYNCDFGEVYAPMDVRPILDGCNTKVPSVDFNGYDNCREICKSKFHLVQNADDFMVYRNVDCFLCETELSIDNLTCLDSQFSLDRKLFYILRSTANKLLEGRGFPVLFLGSEFIQRNSTFYGGRAEQKTETKTEKMFAWYTTISLIISSFFLCVHLVVYAKSKKTDSIGEKNLASFCLALLLAYCSFLVGNYINGSSCIVVSSLTYYFFLVSFTWLFTIAYDLTRMVWRSTKKYRITHNRKTFFLIYTICNWLICLLPMLTLVYLDLYESDNPIAPKFYSQGSGCWFHNQSSLLYFFALPVFFIVLANFLMFSYTSYLICTNKFKSANEDEDMIAKYMLYVRLALLCGLTWLSIFFAFYLKSTFLWFVFIFLNTGQGVFIFVAFTWRSRSSEPVTRVTATS